MKRLILLFIALSSVPLHAALTCGYEPLTGLILCTAGGGSGSGTVTNVQAGPGIVVEDGTTTPTVSTDSAVVPTKAASAGTPTMEGQLQGSVSVDTSASPNRFYFCATDDGTDCTSVIRLAGYAEMLPLPGGTLTGQLVTDNLGIEFEESDTNPTCASGNYSIYADLSETKLKACQNGVATDLVGVSGGGGSGAPPATNLLASGTSLVVTHNENLSDPSAFVASCVDEDDDSIVIPFSAAGAADDVTFTFSGTVTNVRCTVVVTGSGVGIENVVEDTTPQLGGDLDLNGHVVTGLVIGTNVQAYDADLTTYAGIAPSANVQSVLGAVDYSAIRVLLALVPGTNVQAYDADLTTYAGITPSANVQSILSAANYAAILGLLDLESGTDFVALSGGTFSGDIGVPDEAYDATNWNGSVEAPTKNAVRDAIEALSVGGFDATTVDAVTWSDGANASNVWTFDVSGTDTTLTFGNNIITSSAPISAPSFTATGAGGVAGLIGLTQGTANTPGTTEIVLQAPASVTSYAVTLPGATGTGFWLGTDSSGTETVTRVGSTGSGSVVLATSPTLVTPALGTPSSGVMTNVTGLPTAGLVNNAVTSAKMAVVNTRRVCDMAFGNTNGSALADGDLGPQKRLCYIPAAATVVEIDVSADDGTPDIIVARNVAGTVANLVSSALATAASGGIACSKTTGVTGIDGATTCSATLQNTALAAGSYIEAVSGTAGGVAKLMTVHVIYTID